MIEVKSINADYSINFPTDLNEINADVLNQLTTDVKLPKYYCLVALAYKTTLFNFATSLNGKQEFNMMVAPIMAKISDEDAASCNSEVGDILIIDRSSLERSVHIGISTVVNASKAKSYLAKDTELVKSIVKRDGRIIDKNTANSSIILLEFKVVPINTISASFRQDIEHTDPFKIINADIN